MSYKTKLIIFFSLLIFTSTGFARTFLGMYVGASFTNLTHKGINERLNGGVVKLGFDLLPFLAIEGHAGATNDESWEGQTFSAQHAGIYGRLNLRLTNYTVYALAGNGYYKISGFGASEDEVGLSYGLGVDLFGSGRTAVSLNVMQILDPKEEFNSQMDIQGIFLGLTHYFTPQTTTFGSF